MSHFFISYSRANLDFARYLRALLEAEGLRVWMDEEGLSAGMQWWKEIERQIDSCAGFLVVMSPSSGESVYVENEILRALNKKRPIFPVLLMGEPFSMLASFQYENMTANLKATLSDKFLARLRAVLPDAATHHPITFSVVQGNVATFEADVLSLKFAQNFFGADLFIKDLFKTHGISIAPMMPQEIGDYYLRPSEGVVEAKQVLFVATQRLSRLTYGDTRRLTERSLNVLAQEMPDCRHVAMTLHGVGAGLDETEGLLAQLGGLMDALQSGQVPAQLERVTFVEIVDRRYERMRMIAEDFFGKLEYAQRLDGNPWGYRINAPSTSQPSSVAQTPEETKRPNYVLTLIDSGEALEDTFYFGIQRPVHSMGLLCERLSPDSDTSPEALSALVDRIRHARCVIADITTLTPMLYLHIGLAMGAQRPVIFITQNTDNPFYHPETTLLYRKIWELEERLPAWLKESLQ